MAFSLPGKSPGPGPTVHQSERSLGKETSSKISLGQLEPKVIQGCLTFFFFFFGSCALWDNMSTLPLAQGKAA